MPSYVGQTPLLTRSYPSNNYFLGKHCFGGYARAQLLSEHCSAKLVKGTGETGVAYLGERTATVYSSHPRHL
jgi:hypothetical protein